MPKSSSQPVPMRILLVGAGGVGAAFAAIAARRDFYESLLIVDYDAESAERAAGADGRFAWAQVDAGSVEALVAIAREHRITHVMNAVDPRFVMPVFEAARIDGAGPLREFFGVTLPALRGQIAIALTLTVTATLKSFDIVYITTQGGPGTSTTVPAYEAFNRAFNTGQVGSAAAVAIALTVLIMVISWLITRLQPKETA